MSSTKYKNVYINNFSTIVGPLEKESQLRNYDYFLDDYYYNEKSFELAEIKMQKVVIDNLINKTKLSECDFNLILGGDLTNQIFVTNACLKNYNIPFLGLYNACATFTEGLIIGSNFLDNMEQYKNIITITSSHNLTAEKQFRFPIEYGSPRPLTQTFTTTGAVAIHLSNLKGKIKIKSSTIGKVIDLGIMDAHNMGAVMAPAAAQTFIEHLNNFKITPKYYDLILTGDLGNIGKEIFKKYLLINKKIKLNNYLDAGCELYSKSLDVGAGGSGPVCLPLVLLNKIINYKKYKKILIIGTGALHSPVAVNQKNSIPAIAHAISLEVL